MASTTAGRTPPSTAANSAKSVIVKRPAPASRQPILLDYLLFFVCIPLACALVFSLVGTRLTNNMPYLDSLIYMTLHMFIAWWAVSMGAALIKLAFRSWQPPLIAVCVLGFFASIIPAAFMFQAVGEFFGALYPAFAANRADDALPSWDLAYLFHFIRYSIPALPLFLAGVYGYRYVSGVNWFGYPQEAGTQATSEPLSLGIATAQLIEGCTLPNDAVLLAIKAEQHYIQIWSDKGNDLVRFRFKDIPRTLAHYHGTQVHRSWWVNLDQVRSHEQDGRKLALVLTDKLTVPVSLSYKNAVLRALESH
jgi:hypothetical protein